MKTNKFDPEFDDKLTFEPLTLKNWGKFLQLFGTKGACGDCWCMYYRLTPAEFKEGKHNNGNRNAVHELVLNNRPVGIMGFYENEPVGWCAFAPRTDFSRLARSRVHKPIDDVLVWSIPCFFIHNNYRRMGLSLAMLKGVIAHARQQGIKVLEAYPTIPTTEKLPDSFLWIGLYKTFEKAGFKIVDQKSKNRPMVRYYIE